MSAINPDIYRQWEQPKLGESKLEQGLPKPTQTEQKEPNGTFRDVFTPGGNDPTHQVSREDMWKWMGTGGHGLPERSNQPLPSPCLPAPVFNLDMPRLMGTGGL